MICIVVNKARFGLRKECGVLANRIENSINQSTSTKYYEDYRRADFWKDLRSSRVTIIYSLSVISLMVAIFCRACGTKVVWLSHEPNGIAQKLINNSIFYAVATTLVQRLLGLLVDVCGTPNPKNARKFSIEHLPLQYELQVDACAGTGDKIGFLGRRDKTRFLHQFEELGQAGYRIGFFPGRGDRSEEAKREFFNDLCCITNIYLREIAQSGVTPDCLSYGTPIIVSNFDACAALDWGGMLRVIDVRGKSDAEIVADVRAELSNLLNRDCAIDFDRFRETFDQQFGPASFERTWRPVIDGALNSAKS